MTDRHHQSASFRNVKAELLDAYVETNAFTTINKQLTVLLEQPDIIERCCFVIITGLAGIGKTTVSLALLAKHSQSYKSAISFVLRCDKKEHLIKDLSLLADKIDNTFKNRKINITLTVDGTIDIKLLSENCTASSTIERHASGASINVDESDLMDEILKVINENIQNHAPWMILLDNVEVGNATNSSITVWFKHLIEMLRKCTPGIILITSRHRDLLNYLKDSQKVTIIDADLDNTTYRVSYEQAAQIFFGRHDIHSIVDSYGTGEELKDLLERLSFLPLAIKIAGIYIRQENVKYAEYRQLLKNEVYDVDEMHKIMLQDAPQFVDTELDPKEGTVSVINTQRSAITMSVKRILQLTAENDRPNLLLLLNFCAFMDSDNIPVGLIKRFAKKLTKRKVLYVDFKKKMIRYSLIRLSQAFLDVHREVHWVLKSFCFKCGNEAKYKEAIVSLALETFDTFLTSLSAIMPHIASFYTNCNKIRLDNQLQLLLQHAATKMDGHLNAQMQKRIEATAEHLESQWTQTADPDESLQHQNDNEMKHKAQLAAAQATNGFQLPPHNEKFVGREMLLEELEAQHIGACKADVNMTTVLVGPGGIGKSALALAYIYHCLSNERYQRTIWLYAEFPHQLLMQLQLLVKKWYVLEAEDMKSLKESDFVKMFYDYLTNQSNGNTSIVFDNAGTFGSIEIYLPPSSAKARRIDSFITTRDFEWATKYQQTYLTIGQFSSDEVKKYFKTELPFTEISQPEIEQITELLGGLPLAIIQAAAYVKQNQLSINAYIQLCEKQPFMFAKGDNKNMLTVQHTLTLAINQVRKKCGAVDPVVSICAYLSTDHITKELLYSVLKNLKGTEKSLLHEGNVTENLKEENEGRMNSSTEGCSSKQSFQMSDMLTEAITKTVPGIVENSRDISISTETAPQDYSNAQQNDVDDQREGQRKANASLESNSTSETKQDHISRCPQMHVASQKSIDEALLLLEQYCIVVLQVNNIRIHRLTQAVMRNIHKKSTIYQTTYEQILESLMTQLDYDEKDRNDVNRVSALIPHSLYLQELDHQFLLEQNPIKASQLSIKIGRHQLYGVENPKLAVKCFKNSLKITTEQYGESHTDVAATMSDLGNAYGSLGDYEKQRDLLTQALGINEVQFGPDHPETAITIGSLSNAYGALGDYEKQRDLLTRVLAVFEAHYGSNHPSMSITLTNLGNAYGFLGAYEKQRDLLTRALAINEAQFGPDHTQTGITLTNLGSAYGDLGDYEKQRDLLTRALVINEAQFGPDHIQTSITLTNLGNAYGSLGEYEKQRDLLTRALTIKEAQFGPNHPQTSITLTNLGNAYGELGDYEKQRDLLTRALAIKEAHFGPDHPSTSITLTNLGNVYGDLGDYEKQRDLLTRALTIFEAQFGSDHSQTAMTLGSLGIAYGSLGDYEKKRDLLTRALAIFETQFGPNHPQTSITLTNLGNAYGDLGDYEKQRDLLTRALAIKEAQFGPEHPQTSITLTNLGNAYGSLGEYHKQQDLLVRALAIDETQFGISHPQTEITLFNLVHCYTKQGDFVKAEQCAERSYAICSAFYGKNHRQTLKSQHSLNAIKLKMLRKGEYECVVQRSRPKRRGKAICGKRQTQRPILRFGQRCNRTGRRKWGKERQIEASDSATSSPADRTPPPK